MSRPDPTTQTPAGGTRDAIVVAADLLFYQRGVAGTSFADIGAQVNISRGNFYHHFKSKDEILDAVITRRKARTGAMLADWAGEESDPAARLRRFARMLVENRDAIQRYGCPVGTLCSELARHAHPAQADAAMIFGLFRDWLREQFEALGHGRDADALALHLLVRSQGIAALAHAFHDEALIHREIAGIEDWLRGLAPRAANPHS
jgi:AcrR family transcriptional regulator